MSGCLWLIILLVGCGRIGFDPQGAGGTGSMRDGNTVSDGTIPSDGTGTSDATGASDGTAALTCPSGYAPINGSTSKYRVVSAGDNWLPGEQACEVDGTHLMIIDDASEGMLVGVALPGSTVWVGVTDRITTGTFRKVTGPLATYLPWAAGEPVEGGVRCGLFDATTGQMSNKLCGAGRSYICECDGQSAMAGSY